MASYFERSVVDQIASEVRKRSPWSNPTTINIDSPDGGTAAIQLTPVSGYTMIVMPGPREYVALVFRLFPDGSVSESLSSEGGDPLGIPLHTDMAYAGERIESTLARWRDAEQLGVFDSTSSAARWFAGLPAEADLVDFDEFRAALADRATRENYGFALDSEQIIRLLADDSAARGFFENWTADGQPRAPKNNVTVSNSPNWLATAGVVTVAVTWIFFGGSKFPVPLIGLAIAALGVFLSWQGIKRSRTLGGRGLGRAGLATLGAVIFTCWAVYALIALR